MGNSIDNIYWEAIKDSYIHGDTMDDIARRYCCSRTQIKKILINVGVKIRKSIVNKRYDDPTPEEIAERAAEIRKNRLLRI